MAYSYAYEIPPDELKDILARLAEAQTEIKNRNAALAAVYGMSPFDHL